jgi:hypothetical protein
MARWRVDYRGKNGPRFLGHVYAFDGGGAVLEAAKLFHITPAQRFRLVVTRIGADQKTKKSS